MINEVKVVCLSAAMLHHCHFASVAGKQLLPVNEKLYSVCITENCRSHRESPLRLEITEIQTSTGSETTCSRGKQHLPRALRPQVDHRHVNVCDPVGRFRSTLSPSWLRLHMKASATALPASDTQGSLKSSQTLVYFFKCYNLTANTHCLIYPAMMLSIFSILLLFLLPAIAPTPVVKISL